MAGYYVWSGASGSGDGSSWANAYTTLTAAYTANGAGKTYWLAHDHLESTTGDIAYAQSSWVNEPTSFLSVNRAGATPPAGADLLAGATLRATGHIYYEYYPNVDGVIHQPGYGTATLARVDVGSLGGHSWFRNCVLDISTNTHVGSTWQIGQGHTCYLTNFKIKFNNVSQKFKPSTYGHTIVWRNGGQSVFASGSAIPTSGLIGNEFYGLSSGVTMIGCDLSALGSNQIFESAPNGTHRLENCKLGTSAVILTGNNSGRIELVNCRDGAGLYRNDIHFYSDSRILTNTVVYRTDGAEIDGVPFSWYFFSQYYQKEYAPLESFPGVLWNDTVGSPVTLTWEMLSQNSQSHSDTTLWAEVDYLGDASSPITSMATNKNLDARFGMGGSPPAGNSHTSSSVSWTSTGLSNIVKQKMSVTFTPQQAGPIRWRIFQAKREQWPEENQGVYVDPKPAIS